MILPPFLTVVVYCLCLVSDATADKQVFAHYMVGTVTEEHVQIDINDALTMGITGFSLNIGDPSQLFVADTLQYMFNYAPTVGFSLHISMDIWASGDATGGHPELYNDILNQYMSHDGYYQGPNGKPFLTTFSDGGLQNWQWADWKSSALNNNTYFCPDFDGTTGYTSGDDAWWYYWGEVCDCVFSWDAAWERRPGQTAGSDGPGTIEVDQTVMNGAKSQNPSRNYMMGLSSLQYKNAYDTNVYRAGGLTLATRMENILNMSPTPDYVVVITWNDGPESHYVGNIWPEQNTDSDPARYVTAGTEWSHAAWQVLIHSFSTAYRTNTNVMAIPVGNPSVIGAMWYKTIMQDASCPNGDHPLGYEVDTDTVSWAIVIQGGVYVSTWTIQVISGGHYTTYDVPGTGLRYASAPMYPGTQRIEIWDGSTLIYIAQDARCVSSGCPDGIFNMNVVVAPLQQFTSGMTVETCQCGPSTDDYENGQAISCSSCGTFDLHGDSTDAMDRMMDDFLDSGDTDIGGWDETIWHTFVGLETGLNYVWDNGLKGSSFETRILYDGGALPLESAHYISNVGNSHDDGLWGALQLLKFSEYWGQVLGDQTWSSKYFNDMVSIVDWAQENREVGNCGPGVLWTVYDPNDVYKNTVTNALWMQASLRLYIATGNTGYLNNVTDLLTNFFDVNPGIVLDTGLYADGVHEPDCNVEYVSHSSYLLTLPFIRLVHQRWSMDRLMIGNFGLLYQVTQDRQWFNKANDLINAVRTHMTVDGILAENCDASENCGSPDQDGFKGIFMTQMAYFYDAVGLDDELHDANGNYHTDWMALNLRGAYQYARRGSDGRYGNVWYGSGVTEDYNGWTGISAAGAGWSAAKYGTCDAAS
ncbi:hypothetical protein EUX98_g6839 [Antrodiella citrinella]|uniref:Uncharacterized protein n=1 Tax=Antrodiella citrinella TaxID=2447956 RepID=A0A4S4MVH1_9APHY|nr:hypothetical protein EUX98_g6839 [Antrodiella citrinella]